MPERPLPDLTDPLEAPFWSAAAESRLVIQRCTACGYLRWPPAPICPECGAQEGAWTPVEPSGTVWSFTVYHRALSPGFADAVPYAVGLIELDCGVRMIGRVLGPLERIRIDQRVEGRFVPATDAVTFIEWEILDEPDEEGEA